MQPQVTTYRVPVRWAAPQAIAQAVGLGWLYGKAIRGDNGAIRYGGGPGDIQAQRSAFTGYAQPPQLFIGYDPRKVAAGLIRPDPMSLPNASQTAQGPVTRAMHALTLSQIANS